MKQGKGRSGTRYVLLLGALAALLLLGGWGCHGASPEGGASVGGLGPGTDTGGTGVNYVNPPLVFPGTLVEIHGHGFPTDDSDLQILFSRTGESALSGIPAFPVKLSRNLISAIVPSGVSSGLLNVLVRRGEEFLTLAPKNIQAGPQVVGYLLPDTARQPGVVAGDPIRGVVPSRVLLYGLNVDNNVISATVELLSLNRQSSERFPEVAIGPQDRNVQVPGVSDPAIRGVWVELPEELGQKLDREGVIYYLRIRLRASSPEVGAAVVSNSVEIPAMQTESQFGELAAAWPAFISGVWVTPGVQGNLLELYYTVFQPYVQLKWRPVLEWTTDNGQTWQAVDPATFVTPAPDSNDPLDFRSEFIIAGVGVQRPEKGCFAGPGTTYRLYVDIRAAWPSETWPDPRVRAGGIRLRLRMVSEPESHGEATMPPPQPIEGNNVEFPTAAVALRDEPGSDPQNPEPLRGGVVLETFGNKNRALERDVYTDRDSNGRWSVGDPKTAAGQIAGVPIYGSGNEILQLESGKDYLFDTDVGRLYEFPWRRAVAEGDEPVGQVDEQLILQVRAEVGTDPAGRQGQSLSLVWDESHNPGAGTGELHVAQFVVPEGTRLFARGRRPFVVRASGTEGGRAAFVDGEINVDGLDGTEGVADSEGGDQRAQAGRGGFGGPGAGRGGNGGLVQIGSTGLIVAVEKALPAEPGQWGGGAGQTMAYVLPLDAAQLTYTGPCFVYGGAGGGGGFGTPGGVGREGIRLDGQNRPQASTRENMWARYGPVYRVNGIGGPERGSEDLLPLICGSGGGGGGGFYARANISQSETRTFGVGGGGGGGGGGGFRLVARGTVTIGSHAKISARGGNGAPGRGRPLPPSGSSNTYGGWSGACGGGGSGGAILIQATESIVFEDGAELDVSGGVGGRPGTTTNPSHLASQRYPIGGAGGAGRIRLEAGRGVNLPRNIDLTRVKPAPSAEGPSTVGPLLKPVDGGSGVLGALDVGEIVALAEESVLYISSETGTIFYWEAGRDEPIVAVRTDHPRGEFHFTSLIVPEDTTLKGAGNSPIVIRVQGNAEIYGVIDVSGEDGGQVELSGDIGDERLTRGAGGAGGPGGGDGGAGGYGSLVDPENDVWEMIDGGDGQLPPAIPVTELGAYLPEPSWSEREPSALILPARGGKSFDPRWCGDDCASFADHAGGGGGGGGFGADGGMGPEVPGELLGFGNGQGGTAYGRNWFLGLDSEDGLLYGGAGGAGGGASSNTVGSHPEIAMPGTGGGGGGGCFVLAVGGDLTVGSKARIDASGGDAYLSVRTGGAGGAGAGGAILLRVNGNLQVETAADQNAVITVEGGNANEDPTRNYPSPYDEYSPRTGGSGADGRIRIEFPGAGLTGESGVQVAIKPDSSVLTISTSFNGNEIESWVWSKPIPLAAGPGQGLMLIDGVVDVRRMVVELIRANFASTIVRWNVLVDGGEAACLDRAAPDRLFGPMTDFSGLNSAGLKPAYMRFLISFVGSLRTGEVAEINTLTIPWERVDYTPPPPPPPPPPPGG